MNAKPPPLPTRGGLNPAHPSKPNETERLPQIFSSLVGEMAGRLEGGLCLRRQPLMPQPHTAQQEHPSAPKKPLRSAIGSFDVHADA